MTFPTLVVEVAFPVGADTQTWLFLDDSARGLLDTGTLAPDEVWVDVTQWVRSVQIRRGANRIEGPAVRYEAGTATIVLADADRRFDPTNLSGPYVSAGVTEVTPMRAARIRATYNGTYYDLIRGYADSWDESDDNRPHYAETTLQITDAVKVLSGNTRVAGGSVGASEDSGARISRILDSVSWSATDRVIATGNTTLQATDLSGDAWTEMQLVQDTELGEVYIDGAGRAVFRNRTAIMTETRSATSQATFGDGAGELQYTKVDRQYDDTTLANRAHIARTGGSTQTAEDTASQTAYLVRNPFDRSDLLMETDAIALNYAEFIVSMCKDPELRFSSLTIAPQRDPTNLFPQVLGRQFGDRITVVRRPPGGGTITQDVFIRGVSHDIAPQSWRTTWTLQSATRWAFLVLDSATLGILDTDRLSY